MFKDRRLTFVTDENFSTNATKLLEVFDRRNHIRALEAFYKKGTDDIVWIPGIKQHLPDAIIVGLDGGILKNRVEKQALKEANLSFVYLAGGWVHLPWPEFCWKIIKAWPEIVNSVQGTRQPTIFKVSVSSLKVERETLTVDL